MAAGLDFDPYDLKNVCYLNCVKGLSRALSRKNLWDLIQRSFSLGDQSKQSTNCLHLLKVGWLVGVLLLWGFMAKGSSNNKDLLS